MMMNSTIAMWALLLAVSGPARQEKKASDGPRKGAFKETFTVHDPRSDWGFITRRMGWTEKPGRSYSIADESYELYVPASYDGSEPYGLLVWIDAGDGDDLARAYPGTDPTLGRPVVNLEFNSEGGRIFAKHTQDIAGTNNRTAFFLDDELLIAPVALQAITGGRAFIQGPDFTIDRVRTIAIQLESGRLQVPLILIQEQDVDATLGKDSLKKSVVAGLIGLGLVLLFMALYYRLPGVVACVALIIYAVIVLAILKLWPITLTLGGIDPGWHGQVLLPVVNPVVIDTGKSTCPCHPSNRGPMATRYMLTETALARRHGEEYRPRAENRVYRE